MGMARMTSLDKRTRQGKNCRKKRNDQKLKHYRPRFWQRVKRRPVESHLQNQRVHPKKLKSRRQTSLSSQFLLSHLSTKETQRMPSLVWPKPTPIEKPYSETSGRSTCLALSQSRHRKTQRKILYLS